MAVYNRRILLRRAGGTLAAGAGGILVLLGLRKETAVPSTEAKKRQKRNKNNKTKKTKNPKKKGSKNGGSAHGGHKGHKTVSNDLILKNGLKVPAREIAVERKPAGKRSGGETEVYFVHNLLPFQEFDSLDELSRAVEQGEELGLFKLPKA